MPYITIYDCPDCGNTEQQRVSQCRTHMDVLTPQQKHNIQEYRQNIIDKKVRLSMSLFNLKRTAETIIGDSSNKPLETFQGVNQSQASDRNQFHTQKATYRKFRPKIGLCPGGEGVDVKHGSFARVMARRKAKHCC